MNILADYEEFLNDQQLLNIRASRMAVIPCGQSFAENLKYGLYYEPPNRSCRNSVAYIGVYKEKKIWAVGKVTAIGVCEFSNGNIVRNTDEFGKMSYEQKQLAMECIKNTDYYELGVDDLRLYFVDHFHETNIQKTSPGGVMGIRYLNVELLAPKGNWRRQNSTKDVADLLKGSTFE